jgi:hypothetical protein
LCCIAGWRPPAREFVPTAGQDYLDHIQVDEEWRLFDVQGFLVGFIHHQENFGHVASGS